MMKLGLVNKIHELFKREKEDKDQDGSYNYEADPELAAWLTDEVKAFSKDLARQDWLSRELYEHYWGEVFLSTSVSSAKANSGVYYLENCHASKRNTYAHRSQGASDTENKGN